jgi:hypothetical protein
MALNELIDYSNEYILSAVLAAPTILEDEFDEDFRSFHVLAQAGHAFVNRSLNAKEATRRETFADIFRARLSFIMNQYKENDLNSTITMIVSWWMLP